MNSLKPYLLISTLLITLMSQNALADCGQYPNPWICNPGPQRITKACEYPRQYGAEFAAFPGHYTVHMKIGNHRYQDKLHIQSVSMGVLMSHFESFTGAFTVPGVFSAPIYGGTLKSNSRKTTMTFDIAAKENGRTFPVYFVAEGPAEEEACSLSGMAFSPTRDKLMGTFEIVKDSQKCKCGL